MTKLFLIILAVVILVILFSRRGRGELRSKLDMGRPFDFAQGKEKIMGICEVVTESVVKKNARKERVVNLLRESGPLSNAELRAELGVSERSIVRYLDELESEGRTEQVGNTGQKVTYRAL